MTSIVEVFEGLICDDWQVERIDSDWHVRECNVTSNPELKISGAKALGFSLDQKGRVAWPFMRGLPGMHKVCDAIMVVDIEGTALVVAVEMKSGNPGDATTQINNSWLFMKWLQALLDYHKHWRNGWTFCGLISYTPRKQERKGTSRRMPEIQVSRNGPYPVAYIRNKPRLNLHDLHNAL